MTVEYKITTRVDLQKAYVDPLSMPDALLVPGENNAHTWEVHIYNGGEEADLSDAFAYANFERADRYVHRINGDASGNVASVTFDAMVYKVPGPLRVQFFIGENTDVLAVVEAVFNVRMDISGNVVLLPDEISYHPGDGIIVYYGEKFYDVSGTDAVEGDVRDGKKFFRADGAFVSGAADFSETISGVTVTETLISGEDYELTISGSSEEA